MAAKADQEKETTNGEKDPVVLVRASGLNLVESANQRKGA